MVFAVNTCKRRAQEEAACWSYMSLARLMLGAARAQQKHGLSGQDLRIPSAGNQKINCFFDRKEVKWENILSVSKHLCLDFEESFSECLIGNAGQTVSS